MNKHEELVEKVLNKLCYNNEYYSAISLEAKLASNEIIELIKAAAVEAVEGCIDVTYESSILNREISLGFKKTSNIIKAINDL